ncbi:MAG: LPS export ABC transporter periplasmic protein LptC [Alteromonadaceae bacterium]|nr:MAG: LPS export ABC transporter periplasmic protein LptC [Alteromonadaceae bacterium]
MLKTIVFFTVLFITLGAALLILDSPDAILGDDESQQIAAQAIPHSVAHNTVTKHYTEDGVLSYSFDANILEYYRVKKENHPTEDFTLIKSLRLTVYQNRRPWLIRAKEGKITDNGQTLILWDDVVLRHTSDEGNVTELQTSRLTIKPEEKIAETDQVVHIKSRNVELKGEGMRADMKSEKIHLLSKVEGFYDPI